MLSFIPILEELSDETYVCVAVSLINYFNLKTLFDRPFSNIIFQIYYNIYQEQNMIP